MKRNREGGFTLISVIIAVVILSVGIIALGKTQSALIRAQATSAERNVALSIARNYIEEVRARTSVPASEASVTVDETGALAAGGAYQRTLVIQDLGGNLYNATCNVTYPRGATPVSIVTLIYR